VVDAARLRRTKDITSVRSQGQARSATHLSIRARPNDAGVMRVAVSATRDLRTAVRRNRARRRVREAVLADLRGREQARPMDLVITARRSAFAVPVAELRHSVRRVLDAVLAS
jgi:ribonuclease P protein component